MGRRPMHESVEFFQSTSLMVDALSRFAYDGVSHVRCIFWEPESAEYILMLISICNLRITDSNTYII